MKSNKSILFVSLFILLETVLYLYVDLPVYQFVKQRSEWITLFFGYVTLLGLSQVWLLPSLVLFFFFEYLYKHAILASRMMFLFSSVAFSGIVNMILKMLLGRNRPVMYDWYHGVYGFDFFQYSGNNLSFPSGHTNTIFAAAMVIYFWFPKQGIVIFSTATLVALSRVILGMHFLSDVLAGALVAILFALWWQRFYVKKGWMK